MIPLFDRLTGRGNREQKAKRVIPYGGAPKGAVGPWVLMPLIPIEIYSSNKYHKFFTGLEKADPAYRRADLFERAVPLPLNEEDSRRFNCAQAPEVQGPADSAWIAYCDLVRSHVDQIFEAYEQGKIDRNEASRHILEFEGFLKSQIVCN
ncbi:MAG: hypothetical protein AAGE80_06575 [Pseudomonadota bacterium]